MLHPDFRDVLSEFISEGVEFLLIGGFAFTSYAYTRATKDMDLWVGATSENARRVYRALARFGAPLDAHGISQDDFLKPDMIFQFGVPPGRIDVITSVDGVSFDQAWPQRVLVEIEGLNVPVVPLHHLIRMKEATGREQDMLDVKELKKVQQRKANEGDESN